MFKKRFKWSVDPMLSLNFEEADADSGISTGGFAGLGTDADSNANNNSGLGPGTGDGNSSRGAQSALDRLEEANSFAAAKEAVRQDAELDAQLDTAIATEDALNAGPVRIGEDGIAETLTIPTAGQNNTTRNAIAVLSLANPAAGLVAAMAYSALKDGVWTDVTPTNSTTSASGGNSIDTTTAGSGRQGGDSIDRFIDSIEAATAAADTPADTPADTAGGVGSAPGYELDPLFTEALNLQRGMLQDWQNMYGPIESNVSQFYQDLTPEYMISTGLEAQQREFQQSQAQIQRTMAQRGLGGGALEGSLQALNRLSNAEAKAKIRAEAPYKTAQMQSEYLSSAQNRQATIQSGLVNTTTSAAQTSQAGSQWAASQALAQAQYADKRADIEYDRDVQEDQARNLLLGEATRIILGGSEDNKNFLGTGVNTKQAPPVNAKPSGSLK